MPSTLPSATPSSNEHVGSSIVISDVPSLSPSDLPSWFQTQKKSPIPSDGPSVMPSLVPTKSVLPINTSEILISADFDQTMFIPSDLPSLVPSDVPSNLPSEKPSLSPFDGPPPPQYHEFTLSPSLRPSDEPSSFPSDEPSIVPSDEPSFLLSDAPSLAPSLGSVISSGSAQERFGSLTPSPARSKREETSKAHSPVQAPTAILPSSTTSTAFGKPSGNNMTAVSNGARGGKPRERNNFIPTTPPTILAPKIAPALKIPSSVPDQMLRGKNGKATKKGP